MEGLRNPYLDQFVPPRRKEASDKYKNYALLRPQYARVPIRDLSTPAEDVLADGIEDMAQRLENGARHTSVAASVDMRQHLVPASVPAFVPASVLSLAVVFDLMQACQRVDQACE